MAVLLLGASGALAEDDDDDEHEDDFGRKGYAAEITAMYAISPTGRIIDPDDPNVRIQNAWAPGLRFEYRATELWGFEGMFETVKRDIVGEPAPNDIRTYTLIAGARFYLAPGRMQPYFIGGMGVVIGDTRIGGEPADSTEVAFRVGGGVDFYFTNNWVFDFSVEKLFFGSDLENYDYLKLGLGLKWRF